MTNGSGKRFSRITALTCAAAVSCGLVLGGCGAAEKQPEGEAEKDTSILVETTSPQTASIELDGDFIGTVEAEDEITVVAKVAGDVTAAYFEEGDRVEAGDLLFTVDDRSAQISMAQAQASLESANASIASASANKSLQELNLLYTQEQIKQTLGEIDTNQMQLENAVASAKYALKAAQENEALAAEQFGLARDNYEDLEDDLDDLRDSADNMSKYAKQLRQVKSRYDDIKNAGSVDAALSMVGGITVPDDKNDSEQDIAEYYIYEMTDNAASTEYDLGVMIAAAEAQEDTLRSSRSSLDGNKDSLRLSQISAAISKETAKNNVLSAEDAKRLAEKMLEDYELYTKAVIIAGANYQLAGANVSSISAETSLTQAQAGAKQAQAGVDAAQLQLEYTRVTAPVSGVITKKNVTVNNMAAQGAAAYVISADNGVNVTFYVAESVMKELSVGQEVQVERNGEHYEAQISENAGVADSDSGLFKVKAQLLTGADQLITGTSVKLTLATQKAQDVMTIPVDSVYYESQKAYVYCMEGGKAVRTQIETGIANNESVEVKSGLTKDSQVITTWAAQLKDGSDVKLKGEETETQQPENAETESEDAQEDSEDGVSLESETEAQEAAFADVSDTQRLNQSIENRIMRTGVTE
ncbi:MAG: efflux RND transporter periplasmic adaptor subunit [Lachnospiraceae bacterium]|nr:efflux RND transporter periplasmic adaptor subunit [Lachnospiraceae bacterium]